MSRPRVRLNGGQDHANWTGEAKDQASESECPQVVAQRGPVGMPHHAGGRRLLLPFAEVPHFRSIDRHEVLDGADSQQQPGVHDHRVRDHGPQVRCGIWPLPVADDVLAVCAGEEQPHLRKLQRKENGPGAEGDERHEPHVHRLHHALAGCLQAVDRQVHLVPAQRDDEEEADAHQQQQPAHEQVVVRALGEAHRAAAFVPAVEEVRAQHHGDHGQDEEARPDQERSAVP
mmetsp:Transcript_78365/g.229708  ORF Transcript_78365/g.229708 Transcript_78365/m.229708 type:complete len:230 (-) Transcript_78365:713-1402(-)